ncbi:protein of unknown function [Cyanobium sp. NIES-981]|nr:protein of unknown function [Cyanobium sp. NIES-981]
MITIHRRCGVREHMDALVFVNYRDA